MSYPVFGLDEDGKIVVDGDNLIDGFLTPAPDHDSEYDPDTVSSNDPVVIYNIYQDNTDLLQSLDDNAQLLQSIDDGISLLAAQSVYTTGYLSTSALDTFDRVVSGLDYRYYVAYRYDADSYNSILYLSNKMDLSGSSFTLSDALQVQLYRVRVGTTSTYTYHYTVSQAGDISLSIAGNPIYYTNCLVGYPLLGDLPAPSHYPVWQLVLFVLLLMIVFFKLRKR